MKKSSTDLTEGSIAKAIVLFTLPLLAGQVLQALYNSVDAAVVGRAVGTTALAAVTASSDIALLIISFFMGLSAGTGVVFAQCFGARNYKKLHDAIHTGVAFSLLVGVGMAVFGILISRFLIRLVNCPPEVEEEAVLYLRIYLVGVLFTSIYNVGSGVLRAVGDSRNPFYYLAAASGVNILLDIVLVVILKLGVAGAAIATVVSQLLSVVLVFRRLMLANDVYRMSLRELRIDGKLLGEIMRLGLPAAVQMSLNALSNIFILRYINFFGTEVMAGIGTAKKIDKFLAMVGQTVGLSIATFIGQNVGAGKLRRAFSGLRGCLLLTFLYVAVVGTASYIFAPALVSIFTSEPGTAVYGINMLRTMLPFFYLQSLVHIMANACRGFGKSAVVTVLTLAGMIGCRQLFLAVSMAVAPDVFNIYICYPVGWFCASLFVIVYYWLTIRRKHPAEARLLSARS